jgi:hypothetical protein
MLIERLFVEGGFLDGLDHRRTRDRKDLHHRALTLLS